MRSGKGVFDLDKALANAGALLLLFRRDTRQAAGTICAAKNNCQFEKFK